MSAVFPIGWGFTPYTVKASKPVGNLCGIEAGLTLARRRRNGDAITVESVQGACPEVSPSTAYRWIASFYGGTKAGAQFDRGVAIEQWMHERRRLPAPADLRALFGLSRAQSYRLAALVRDLADLLDWEVA